MSELCRRLDKDPVRDAAYISAAAAGGGAGEHVRIGRRRISSISMMPLSLASPSAGVIPEARTPVRFCSPFRAFSAACFALSPPCGADAQPVKLRDDRGGAGRQAYRGSGRDDPLSNRIVGPKDSLATITRRPPPQFTGQGADFSSSSAAVEEPVHGVDELAGASLTLTSVSRRRGRSRPLASDHLHPGDIPSSGRWSPGWCCGRSGPPPPPESFPLRQLVHGLDHAAGHPPQPCGWWAIALAMIS